MGKLLELCWPYNTLFIIKWLINPSDPVFKKGGKDLQDQLFCLELVNNKDENQ